MFIDRSSIPGFLVLAKSVHDVLPDDDREGDPAYLSKSALEIGLARNWADHGELIARGLACAQKYWSGEASEDERERLQIAIYDQWRLEKAEHGEESKRACECGLVLWSLDAHTPSCRSASDYFLDAAIRAGVSVEELRGVLERNVPGLTAALAKRGVGVGPN